MNDLVANRLKQISSFHVMALLEKARVMEKEGESVIHLEIGEPDFPAPKAAAQAFSENFPIGVSRYTPASGLPELRLALSKYYLSRFKVSLDFRRLIITPGASGGLLISLATILDPGDEVILADPGYPCNKNIINILNGVCVNVPVNEQSSFQLTAKLVSENWTDKTKVVLIASPSNPTGTVISPLEIQRIIKVVEERNGILVVDEIYQELVYGVEKYSVLQDSQNAIVVNSFSKYFCLSGWRVGWLVMPHHFLDGVDRLAQNIFLSTSSPAQYMALKALSPLALQELDQQLLDYEKRRDFLVTALLALGFKIPMVPTGAFYIYADCQKFTNDSYQFSKDMLALVGVAVTPGCDFGNYRAEQFVRFSYTAPIGQLREAVSRIKKFINC